MPNFETKLNYGKYGGNPQTTALLDRMAKRPIGRKSNMISPEYGAMLQGEDNGIPETIDAQHLPFQAILSAYPTIPIESALKLAGAYIYPERANESGTPIKYLQGHENSHLLDKIAMLNMRENVPAEGIGNKGYMPVKRTSGRDQTTPAGIENWLLEYAPENRPEERKAHIAGLNKLNRGY